MSQYDRIEGRNMAPLRSEDEIAVLTPRLEQGDFSSMVDFRATLETGEDSVTARGRLTNLQNETAGAFLLETRFAADHVRFHAEGGGEGVTFVLPVVSAADERIEWSDHQVVIHKPGARVVCETTGLLGGDAARIFHFVPGVQAVRLAIAVPAEGVDVYLRIQR
jgi:hypothetical protein